MWASYLRNVQRAVKQGRLTTNEDIADFIANEYDKTIKKGGDLIYKVNVINGNKEAMASTLKNILDKNSNKQGENINLFEDLPKAFDAYWLGAEYSPIPNPLLRPQGWAGTVSVDVPNAVIVSPDFTIVSASAIKNQALKEILKQSVEKLKTQTVTIELPKKLAEEYLKKYGVPLPMSITIGVYDTVIKLLKKENPFPEFGKEVKDFINNYPAIQLAKKLIKKYNEAKKKKPSAGRQNKKGTRFKLPKLADIKKLIKEAAKRLEEQITQEIENKIKEIIEELVIKAIVSQIETIMKTYKDRVKKLPTREQIKNYVKKIKEQSRDGLQNIKDDLTPFKVEGIPTKEEFKILIENSIPSAQEINAIVKKIVKDLLPKIPYIELIKPNPYFIDVNKIVWGKPFVREANNYLLGVEGTLQVLAQCAGPTSPPTPIIIRPKRYKVKMGPIVPPIPSGIPEPSVKLSPIPDKLPEKPDINSIATSLIKIPSVDIGVTIPQISSVPSIPRI